MKKSLIAVAALALAALSTPANAATLPDNQTFYAFDWFGNFYSIDTETGASTLLAEVPEASESSASDYNPVDGKIYVLAHYGAPELVVFDPATDSREVIQLTGDLGFNARGMAITEDGTIYACLDDVNLYTLNGVTGESTLIGPLNDAPIASMAWDELNGTLYGVDNYDDRLGDIDTATGDWDLVTAGGVFENGTNGFSDFDSNGVLWFSNWGELFSLTDLTSNTPTFEANIDFADQPDGEDGTESGFIAPDSLFEGGAVEEPTESEENLAATGIALEPIVALGAAAIAGGLVIARMRRRTV